MKVVVENFQFLGSGNAGSTQAASAAAPATSELADDVPF
jgi:hypothetical protein